MTEEEMQDYFPKVYPKMFVGQYGGIAIGVGWFNLLNNACRLIQSHLDWKPDVPQVTVEQVKEKFGGLRFYVQGGDEYTNGVIAMAEQMSGLTCELCGAPGEQGGTGWISTLCPTHRLEREQKRAEYMKSNGLEE
jgi:hypothetical protein